MKDHTQNELMPYQKRSGANGELPELRKRMVEQGLTFFQEVAQERDALQAEVARLRTDIASYKVMVEGHTAQMTEMQSRVATMTIVRDQAVADRAKYESLFVMLNAQMRAFAIPAAPLVTEAREPDGMIEADGPVTKEELDSVRDHIRKLRT